jgi:hypothetical protein
MSEPIAEAIKELESRIRAVETTPCGHPTGLAGMKATLRALKQKQKYEQAMAEKRAGRQN